MAEGVAVYLVASKDAGERERKHVSSLKEGLEECNARVYSEVESLSARKGALKPLMSGAIVILSQCLLDEDNETNCDILFGFAANLCNLVVIFVADTDLDWSRNSKTVSLFYLLKKYPSVALPLSLSEGYDYASVAKNLLALVSNPKR